MGMVFHFLDKDIIEVFTTIIKPILECVEMVCCLHKKNYMKNRKNRKYKMVPEFKNLTWEERLKEMELPKLESWRKRGNLIVICKLTNYLVENTENNYYWE